MSTSALTAPSSRHGSVIAVSYARMPDVIAARDGYVLSQRERKLINQGFGSEKTVGEFVR